MRIIIVALIASFISTTAFAQESADWQKVADAIPLGSKVKVQTIHGSRVNGTLMRVDGSAVTVKKNNRYPEPAVVIRFDDVATIERHKDGGVSIVKVIAGGLAAGAGAMVTLILFAIQLD